MNIDVILLLRFNNRIFTSGKYLRKTFFFSILPNYIRKSDGLSITDSLSIFWAFSKVSCLRFLAPSKHVLQARYTGIPSSIDSLVKMCSQYSKSFCKSYSLLVIFGPFLEFLGYTIWHPWDISSIQLEAFYKLIVWWKN